MNYMPMVHELMDGCIEDPVSQLVVAPEDWQLVKLPLPDDYHFPKPRPQGPEPNFRIYQERIDLCATVGLTVWEAENKVASGEVPWGSVLEGNLSRYRSRLGEPFLHHGWK